MIKKKYTNRHESTRPSALKQEDRPQTVGAAPVGPVGPRGRRYASKNRRPRYRERKHGEEFRIQCDFQALLMAFYVGASTSNEETFKKSVALAESFAAQLPRTHVELAKLAFDCVVEIKKDYEVVQALQAIAGRPGPGSDAEQLHT